MKWASFRPTWASPPGDTIRHLMEERGWSAEMMQEHLDLSPQNLQRLLEGRLPIDADMAQSLADLSGAPALFWRTRERHYREGLERIRRRQRRRHLGQR